MGQNETIFQVVKTEQISWFVLQRMEACAEAGGYR